MKVCLIPPGFVAGMYHDIIPFLSRLAPTTNGRYDDVDLYNNLLLNKESLWTVVNTDEKTAVRHGCDSMQVMGRRGWVKKLQSYDWKEEFVIVSKDLKEHG